jgi:hypothetical protein
MQDISLSIRRLCKVQDLDLISNIQTDLKIQSLQLGLKMMNRQCQTLRNLYYNLNLASIGVKHAARRLGKVAEKKRSQLVPVL